MPKAITPRSALRRCLPAGFDDVDLAMLEWIAGRGPPHSRKLVPDLAAARSDPELFFPITVDQRIEKGNDVGFVLLGHRRRIAGLRSNGGSATSTLAR